MRKPYFAVTVVLSALTMATCDNSTNPKTDPDLTAPAVVPKPASYIKTNGQFELTANSGIIIQAGGSYDTVKQNTAEYLAAILRGSTGFAVTIAGAGEEPVSGDIVLALNYPGGVTGESYALKVEQTGITIMANEPEGLFRGVQTLRQLFGPDIERTNPVQGKKWMIDCAEITDSPAYQYRGLMLDVARHFFPKEVIMRQIDLAAGYKINKLHLHLTDDQGWRIEIKSRPALTGIGSLGSVGDIGGGYYTQDDFKEIVEYAAARYIEVIPEIDMPGHTNAALVSIPELNPGGRTAEPYYGMDVGFSSFQCRSEATYQFLEDVIGELAAISPSKYFHIGGDEAHATPRPDYDYFIGRVSEMVKSHGKTTIGWSPYIRAEGVLTDAALQAWEDTDPYISNADQKGLPVILSPAGAYLDQQYNSRTPIGSKWRGFVPLSRSYNWYPSVLAPNSIVAGVESALWAETITGGDDIDYLLYPRLLANAEIGWTDGEARNFDAFKKRLPEQFERLDALKVNYSRDYD